MQSVLQTINPWWGTGKVPSGLKEDFYRNHFYTIKDLVHKNRILSLIGPRRVGKTTIFYQLIDHLLTNGTKPKYILYLSGDNELLWERVDKVSLEKVFNHFFNEVAGVNPQMSPAPLFIFIDEIHYIKNWERILKFFFDQRYNIHFYITGSSALHLTRKSAESLAGRIVDEYILPLDFKEFCKFCLLREKVELPAKEILDKLLNQKTSVFSIIKGQKDTELQTQIALVRPFLTSILRKYILAGGYPEYFKYMDLFLWQRYLRSDIIDKVLFRDIVDLFNVRSPRILRKLLLLISQNNSQLFSYTSMSNTLDVDTETIETYLEYLTKALLIQIRYFHSKGREKTIRKNKKISIIDSGVCNALLFREAVKQEEEGLLLESLIAAKFLPLELKHELAINYIRNDQEIDIVIERGNVLYYLEVKKGGREQIIKQRGSPITSLTISKDNIFEILLTDI